MKREDILSQFDFLPFDGSPETGYFKRKKSTSMTKLGEWAGSIDGRGYRIITLNSKSVKEHRMVFLLCYGFLPEQIDHIDGNPLNNHPENLRASNQILNKQNKLAQSNSKTGIKGVSFDSKRNRWFVCVKVRVSSFDEASDLAAKVQEILQPHRRKKND